jgi:bifunctional DNA-binding transcriptional regulator/antitoxin component of YhaV-PrlF toxin-antitoxin module
MARAKVGQRFTIVLPRETRIGLAVEDPVDVVRRDDGVIEIRPMILVEKSQAGFWTSDWQQRERAVDDDYARGRFRVHASTDEFLTRLDGAPDAPSSGSDPESPTR